jgi:hypothetical protein
LRKSVWALGLALATLGWQGQARAQAQQVRVAVVVGNNQGHDQTRTLRYAEDEVQRLADLLRSTGEFDKVDILRGAGRRSIEDALSGARQRLDAAKSAGHRTMFLFYYSGHGDNEALEIGAARLPLRDLRSYLEQMTAADVRVAFVDACQSGALTGVKGGRRAPSFDVRLADPGTVKGMAIVTSSTANEYSQESDDLKGSYFSQAIMAGLRGAADTSRDGQVSLSELYQFAFKQTLANTAATLVGGQHPTYDYRMAGAGDVILTRTHTKDARLAFAREAGATYTVFAKSGGEVVAELPSSSSEDYYLAVPAGEYRVVRRTLGSVAERTLALAAGSSTTVSQVGMTEVHQGADNRRRKGGDGYPVNVLGAHAGVSTNALSTGTMAYGMAALSYARDLYWVILRVRGQIASFDSQQEGYRSSFLRTGGDINALVPVFVGSRLALHLGPYAGVPVVRQRDFRGDTMNSIGFAYGGIGTIGFRLYGNTGLQLGIEGGAEVFRLNGKVANRPTAQASLGAIVAF